MPTEPKFNSNLTDPHNYTFDVPYPHAVEDGDDRRNAEVHMKSLINDVNRSGEMELTAVHIRLKNKAKGQATNSTFLLSLRDDDGDMFSRKPRRRHRFNEHGKLHTVGTRTARKRQGGYSVCHYEFCEVPQPYQQAPTHGAQLEPRQEERVKIAKNESLFHPDHTPTDGQVRYSFSHTNDFSRNLVKRDLLDNATTFKATPEAKKSIKHHFFGDDYTGKLLRVITKSGDDGSLPMPYFKCIQNGGHNHWHVQLDEHTTLKN